MERKLIDSTQLNIYGSTTDPNEPTIEGFSLLNRQNGSFSFQPIRHSNSSLDGDDGSSVDSDLLHSAELLIERSKTFTTPFDKDNGFRATALEISKFSRPHMRAFHGSWIGYFVSCFVQFAISPLLPEIQRSLNLTKSQIWVSNIWMVLGGIPIRFLLGPLCDKYGARLVLTAMLALTTVPCACSGFVQTLEGLIIVRFLIGALDAFVPSQYWITCQFVREISGTTMAMSSGWGAAGAGVVQIVLATVLFPIIIFLTKDYDISWRLCMILPALISISVALYFYLYSDDCPLGNFNEIKRAGLMVERNAVDSFRSGVLNLNSWILFLQFAGSCGVDLTMCNGTAVYYHARFNQTTASSGAIGFLYCISAIFARGLGGWASDIMYNRMSMAGRLWAQLVSMVTQGLLIIWWARTDTLGLSVCLLVAFSILVQTSTATCFAIVPYVDGPNTGSVAGIVGAGGNVGAVLLGNVFRTHSQYAGAAEYMGWFAIGTALLTPFIVISGYKGILFGEDNNRKRENRILVPS